MLKIQNWKVTRQKEQWSDCFVIDTSRDSTVRFWETGRQLQNDQPTVVVSKGDMGTVLKYITL